MKKAFLLSSLLLVAALACNLMTPDATSTSPSEAATVTPEIFIARTQAIPGTEVPAATDTPQQPSFEGVKASFGPLSFVLPPGLVTGISGEQFPRAEGDNVAPWELTPGHTVVQLEGYPLQGRFHEPKIFVYPAQGYAEMFPAAFESMHRLNNIFGNAGAPIGAEQLPTVPFFNAGQLFASNVQAISFQNGKGVRFLTEYAQYFAPVNNHDLFYQFQGLTGDGAYYVIAILPVSSPALAETSEAGAAVPAGGVALPDINDPNADWKGYYDAVTNVLNAETSESFGPALRQLDALIQSMQVVP